MPTVTIGSAGADFATLALWETNLVGSGGLKATAEGKIFAVTSLNGNTFNGIDTSAFRVVMKPSTSGAFWQHVSASSNPIQSNQSFGAYISGNATDGLTFNDVPVTISGLMFSTSAGYARMLVITDTAACAAVRDTNVINSIFYNRSTGGGATAARNIEASGAQMLRLKSVVSWMNAETGADRGFHVKHDMATPARVEATNCTFVATSGTQATWAGRAVAVRASAPILRNNLFLNNDSNLGDVSGANVTGGHNVSNIATASTVFLSSAAPFWGGIAITSSLVSFQASAGVPYGLDASLKSDAATTIVDNACAAWVPATDVLNRTRQAPHDIGAFDLNATWSSPPPPPPPAASNVYPYNPLGNLVVDLGGLRYY